MKDVSYTLVGPVYHAGRERRELDRQTPIHVEAPLAAVLAVIASLVRWRRPPHDTRAFTCRSAVALVEIVGAGMTVVLLVSFGGFFTETWHWLRVPLERDAFYAWMSLAFGLAGGLSTAVMDPPGWWPPRKSRTG